MGATQSKLQPTHVPEMQSADLPANIHKENNLIDPSASSIDRDVLKLLNMFPHADPLYIRSCLQYYKLDRIAHVANKIIELNHGHYPRIAPLDISPHQASRIQEEQSPRNKMFGIFSRSRSESASSDCTPCSSPPSKTTPQPVWGVSSNLYAFATSAATRNEHLHTLSELYPDADVAFLKEQIKNHPENTVENVVNNLSMGKYRKRKRWGEFRSTDLFRSEEYMRGARCRLFNEFPDLWKSSIKAYLAENNYDYVSTFMQLQALPQKPTFFLFTLLKRKPINVPEMYTLELLQDLQLLESQTRSLSTLQDFKYAKTLHLEEAQEANCLVTCGCCFDGVAWEDIAACNGCSDEAPHLICLSCLGRTAQEAVFGQQTRLLGPRGLACIHSDGCDATFDDHWILRAFEAQAQSQQDKLLATKGNASKQVAIPDDVFILRQGGWRTSTSVIDSSAHQAYNRYCNKVALSNAVLADSLIQSCAFCDYFEIDPTAVKSTILEKYWFCILCLFRIIRLLVCPIFPRLSFLHTPLKAANAPDPAYANDPVVRRLKAIEFKLDDMFLQSFILRTIVGCCEFSILSLTVGHFWSVWTCTSYLACACFLGMCIGSNNGRNARDRLRNDKSEKDGPNSKREMASQVRVLVCKNPSCRIPTCLTCRAEYMPHHRCFEPAEETLQQYVDRAMSSAIKRVCPHCSLAFTKSDGCNLMTCPRCRYIMCYVCRKGIKDEKYRHFCQHFRLEPGACTECNACELYVSEDEGKVRRAAGERALEEWLASNPHHGLNTQVVHAVRKSFQQSNKLYCMSIILPFPEREMRRAAHIRP